MNHAPELPCLAGRTRRFLWIAAAALLACAGGARAEDQPKFRDPSLPVEQRIDDLLSRLTLDEKIALVHANGKFSVSGVPRLGIPQLWMTDGPQGVREEISADSWDPVGGSDDFATAMPSGIGVAATWDTELASAFGTAVAEEARARGKHVILAPGVNIMRTPLCGRNYDYYGEDPWLAGRMAVSYIRSVQAEGVVTCVKHYAANNQETARDSVNVEMDERTLREIYLPAFEAAIREGGSLSIMSAYNRFRGEFCGENDYLLSRVLKGEWGFRGAVVSDWSGTHTTAGSVRNGLDIEMGTNPPYDANFLARPYRDGIEQGTYSMDGLDEKVRRNLRVFFASGAIDGQRAGSINTPAHQKIARRLADEAIVLLKNENGLLPLDPKKFSTIAVIGDNAVIRYAGLAASAGVKAFREITALEGISERAGPELNVIYSRGYRQLGHSDEKALREGTPLESISPEAAEKLAARAVEAARISDVVIFVGGLSHLLGADDEGADRKDLTLLGNQAGLISRIAAVNPRTVVVLISGSPVAMDPWLDKVPAVMEAWYGGSEAGRAIAAALFGDTNPSGRLPCTFPRKLSDSPAHASGLARHFPGENGTVSYDEGLLVGYRWFDAKKIEPLFPFGFGLSYTTFAFSNLRVRHDPAASAATAVVTCDVTNTGQRAGAEVVQVYVEDVVSTAPRPPRELKGFARVELKPGETKTVEIPLGPRAFAFYDPQTRVWKIEAGEFRIHAGHSSRELPLTASLTLEAAVVAP